MRGDFEELLSKARFEEARLHEVLLSWNRPRDQERAHTVGRASNRCCHHCTQHGRANFRLKVTRLVSLVENYALECPRKGRALPVMSLGSRAGGKQVDEEITIVKLQM